MLPVKFCFILLSGFRRKFRNQPTRNKNCLWRPHLLMNWDEMWNLNRGLPTKFRVKKMKGPSWIYNYLSNQCLSPLMLWDPISMRARCTTLCDNVCQWLATGRWFSLGPPVSSTNKTDLHDIAEILLKVALNTIKKNKKTQQQQTNNKIKWTSIATISSI